MRRRVFWHCASAWHGMAGGREMRAWPCTHMIVLFSHRIYLASGSVVRPIVVSASVQKSPEAACNPSPHRYSSHIPVSRAASGNGTRCKTAWAFHALRFIWPTRNQLLSTLDVTHVIKSSRLSPAFHGLGGSKVTRIAIAA